MWETLSAPWQACIEEAWAAYRAGSVPIGACITDPDGRILTRGRNRIHDEGAKIERLVQNHDLAHAEMNALLVLDNDPVERRACILYTTNEPCPLCLGAWYMSGVRNLAFAARDPWAGSVNLLGTTPYLSRKAVRVTAPERHDLETLVVALHVDFTLRAGAQTVADFLALWRAVVPEGVALGERLHRAGLLRRWAEEGIGPAALTDQISRVALR